MINERETENILENILRNKEWKIDLSDDNRQVYRQSPRSAHEKKLLDGDFPDYMLYLDEYSDIPDAIIEVKRPKQNLENAMKQGIDYANKLNTKIVFVFDGTNTLSMFIPNETPLILNENEIREFISPDQLNKFIKENTNEINTISEIAIESKKDLINVFKYANNQLRRAGITTGMERFTDFSNLLFLKLISENNQFISSDIPESLQWDAFKNKTGDELLFYLNDVVIQNLNTLFSQKGESEIFTKLSINDPVALKNIINKMSQLKLSEIETDIKGDAFEYFIQKYNSGNKDLGEYFTPRHIVNFMVKLANPQYGEKIYDPFCGTGGMLIATYKHILEKLILENMATDSVLQDLKHNTLYGSEISNNAKIAKMNMILTGDGHSNIKKQNTLKNLKENFTDIVITNIPFSQEGVVEDKFPIKTINGDSQCLQTVLLSLKKSSNSRALVIVPEGVLNNRELKETREYLINKNYLKGIISLPSGVFLPYTDAKTSILCLGSENSFYNDKIFHYKVNNDGFTLTNRRRPRQGINDFDEFMSLNPFSLDFFEEEHNLKNLTFISKEDIKENKNYSLMYFKYLNISDKNTILLKDIIREVNEKNTLEAPTATISNKHYLGIENPHNFWGDNFDSVTSSSNEDYKLIRKNIIAYNPSRANVGSIGINIYDNPVAVSKMYKTFEVFNEDFLPEYIYILLRSKDILEEIKIRSFGAVRQTLDIDDLKTIAIKRVDLDYQKKIVNDYMNLYHNFKKYQSLLDDYTV